MSLSRKGIIENHQGFGRQFGRIVTRIGTPTPLNVVPWEKYRRDRFVYGDHTYVGGVQYYYHQSFKTQDEAIEFAQRQIDETVPYRIEEIEKGTGRMREHIKLFPNIDGSSPSMIVTFKDEDYHVLTDDTVVNYQRQQALLKGWRESIATDSPEPFEKAYWGTGRQFLEHENKVDTSKVPDEVISIMSRVGFTAKTTEEEEAEMIAGIFGTIGELRKEAGLEPIEPLVRPLVSGDVKVRKYTKRRP